MHFRLTHPYLLFCVGLFCLPIAAGAHEGEGIAPDMSVVAHQFLGSLNETERAQATFPLDGPQRLDWHFVPKERVGLPVKVMRADQRQLALLLLHSALSHRGFQQAMSIMTLEQILFELENNAPHRDAELYYLCIFGEPAEEGTWGWRMEGHHLSVSCTIVAGKVVSCAPTFFGANPAEVRQGPRQGLRVLASEEDLARQLVQALDESQRSKAVIDATAPADILLGPQRKAEPLAPMGLPAGEMSSAQQEVLQQLLRAYVFRWRGKFAREEWQRIEEAGWDRIHFAWAGGLQRGEPHYYRVQGTFFVLEYDNTQNNANHIHTVWRDFQRDFGADPLRAHYQQSKH